MVNKLCCCINFQLFEIMYNRKKELGMRRRILFQKIYINEVRALTVRAEGNGIDRLFVPRERRDAAPSFDVPQFNLRAREREREERRERERRGRENERESVCERERESE